MNDPSKQYQKQQKFKSPDALDSKILAVAKQQAEANAANNSEKYRAAWLTWMPGAATAAILLIGITFVFNTQVFVTDELETGLLSETASDLLAPDIEFSRAAPATNQIPPPAAEPAPIEIPTQEAQARVQLVAEDAPAAPAELSAAAEAIETGQIQRQESLQDAAIALETAAVASSTTAETNPTSNPQARTTEPDVSADTAQEPLAQPLAQVVADSSPALADDATDSTTNISEEIDLVDEEQIAASARTRLVEVEVEEDATEDEFQIQEIIVTGRKTQSFNPFRAIANLFRREEMEPTLIEINTRIPDLILNIKYATSDNFLGEPVDGYQSARAMLTEPAIIALAAVQNELRTEGLGLKIFDAYRPQRAVDHFIRWSQNDDLSTKAEYYPNLEKPELFSQGYLGERSSHSRGSTVDLTIVRFLEDGSHAELNMGTAFDFFDPTSWPDSTEVSDEAQANRKLLRELMMRHGFEPFETEWWHFTLNNEPYPAHYFDVSID